MKNAKLNSKKLLSILLSLIILISVTAGVDLSAYASTTSGSCGENVTWILDDEGTLIISGTGPMTDYSSSSSVPWVNYRELIKKVVIQNGITSIGNYAFEHCRSLSSVTIGNSVTSIGSSAFSGCTGLTSVTIPDSVTNIGNSAFFNCTSLTSVTIPNSVTIIGNGTFGFCTNLTSVTIPNSITSIENYAFWNCTSLTSVTIPNSVTSIGDYAFYYCTSLTDVYYTGIQEEWSNIAIGSNNDHLIYANMHYSHIHRYESIVTQPTEISDGYTTYICECGDSYIDGVSNYVSAGFCGEKVTWILDDEGTLIISGSGPTTDYSSSSSVPWVNYRELIKKVVIQNGVTSIGSYAFYNCTSLTSVTIPNSVTSIGVNAFVYCTSLISLNIPDSVTNIGWYAFIDVTNIIYHGEASHEYDWGAKALNGYVDGYLVYKDSTEKELLGCCSQPTEIAIPNSVTNIGYKAFSRCKNLKSVDIPNSVTYIGDSAFSGCTSLTSVTISFSINTISGNSFDDCTSLESITIPNSVTEIKGDTFRGCNNLKNVYFIGDEDEWARITIDSNNEPLKNAEIHYIAHEHNFTQKIVNPTCVDNGYIYYFCTVCLDSYYETAYIHVFADSSDYPESPHNYENSKTYDYSFSYDGAVSLELTFSTSTFLESNFDFLYIYDKFDNQIGKYSGDELAGKTITVNGDLVKLKLTTDSSVSKYGFSLDSVYANVLSEELSYLLAKGHSFTNYVADGNATCTSDGTKTAKCDRCDETDSIIEEGTAIGHSFVNYVRDNVATCIQNDTETAVCEYGCGTTDTKEIPDSLADHIPGSAIIENEIGATCIDNGSYDSVVYCSVCNIELSREQKPSLALGHSFTNYVSNDDAICMVDGTETAKCDRCDVTDTKADEKSALDHIYVSTVTDATCTSVGYTTYVCSRCNDTYVADFVDMIEHTPAQVVNENMLEATCTNDGSYDSVIYCLVCNTELSRDTNIIPQIDHNYVVAQDLSTCTKSGYVIKKCSMCGKNTAETVPAKGHSFTNYESNNDATCVVDGTKTAKCDRCDATDTKADENSALGHNYIPNITAPTCISKGYTTYVCSRCSDTYVGNYVDMVEHTSAQAIEENRVEATCTSDGSYDSVVYCSVCNIELSREQKTSLALGHSFTNYVSNNDTTCTADGTKTAKCDRCDVTDTKPDIGSIITHKYVAVVSNPTCQTKGYTTYTCADCSDVYVSDYTDIIDHIYELEVCTATCIEAGFSILKCTMCDNIDVLDVEALGHNYIPTVTNATCTSIGYTTYVCSRCTDTYVSDYVDMVEHTLSNAVEENRVEATCTADGSYDSVVYCSVCKTEISRDTIILSSIEHNYFSTVSDPTCSSFGFTIYICGLCGSSYIDMDSLKPKTQHLFISVSDECIYGCGTKKNCSHSWVITNCVEASCVKTGKTSYKCEFCGVTKTEIIPFAEHCYNEITISSTPFEKGYTKYVCESCNFEYIDNFLPYATDNSVLMTVLSSVYIDNSLDIFEKYNAFCSQDISQLEIDNAIMEILEAQNSDK